MISKLVLREQSFMPAFEWSQGFSPSQTSGRVHERVAIQAAATPEVVAVALGHETLTYQELNARADQLTHFLRAHGIGSSCIVGLHMTRSIELAIAVLAILKAGAAYLPLDPSYPPDRLAFMAKDSAVPMVIVDSKTAGLVTGDHQIISIDEHQAEIRAQPRTALSPIGGSNDLAYVLYTSGSTGQPKGVAMPHQPLANLIDWHTSTVPVPLGTKTLQYTSLSFDVSFQEIFSCWCAGGTLVLIDEPTRRDRERLLRAMVEQGVQQLFVPNAVLRVLADTASESERLPPLVHVFTAGERLEIDGPLRRFFERLPGCQLHNHYGPTEAHVVTSYTLTGKPAEWPTLPPIGRPIWNPHIHVLDANLSPVAVGVEGELYIGGNVLAQGYLGRSDLTAQRFIPDPFVRSQRLYRTGDLACWRADGTLDCLGRLDDQVKIRGNRVELGEIEVVLSERVGIAQAVVTATRYRGEMRLVAHIVGSKASPPPSSSVLREELRKRLPEYMVPGEFRFLESIPMTPSGKVDRHALGEAVKIVEAHNNMPAGSTPSAQSLAALFSQVIAVPVVGPDDDFFDVGGNSLSLMRLLQVTREVFQADIDIDAFADGATPRQLARTITKAAVTMVYCNVLGVEHVDTNADFFDVGGTSLSLMRLLAQINGRFGTQLGIDAVADGVTVANLTSVVFGSHPSI